MSRKILGCGARGDLVGQAQQALKAGGFLTGDIDEIYGHATRAAVNEFQSGHGLPVIGVVDDSSWTALTGSPVPPIAERCLQITAALEGHGYGLAVGDFDGALMTWGIVGFTMKAGEVQQIVLAVNQQYPALVHQAFGSDAEQLLAVMSGSRADQAAWAASVTTSDGAMAEPWKSGFAAFGEMPFVRAEQRKHVSSDYFVPARQTAARYGLRSELSIALCFDIHVQDGGIGTDARADIAQAVAASPHADEPSMRRIIANAVADHAAAEWREDVRSRKMLFANGSGSVHGQTYRLEDWGVADLKASAAGGC